MRPVTMPAQPSAPALTPSRLTALRTMLEEQRNFRIEQLAQLRDGNEPTLLRGVDREISDSLVAGARAALDDVLDALRRMDAGTYGICTDCQAPLPIERLEILPQVARCIACQRRATLG
jgi:RNA polymerase-binding transcription factor